VRVTPVTSQKLISKLSIQDDVSDTRLFAGKARKIVRDEGQIRLRAKVCTIPFTQQEIPRLRTNCEPEDPWTQEVISLANGGRGMDDEYLDSR
jgi:hypothetical protein